MSQTIEIEGPELYPKQYYCFFRDETWIFVEGSTKSGKTLGAEMWLAKHAIEAEEGKQFCWVAPFSSQAKMAFDELRDYLPDQIYSHHKNDRWIDIEGGGRIWFKSGDDPDTIYGHEYWAIVVDEASRVKNESWMAVRSTREATGAPVRAIGNVVSRDTWHYKQCRLAEQGDIEDAAYMKLTCEDAVNAGIISPEAIEAAEKNYRQMGQYDRFLALYYCIPPDEGSNPFGHDSLYECAIDPERREDHPAEYPTFIDEDGFSVRAPVVWGWDLARSVNYTVGIPLDQGGYVTKDWKRFQDTWPNTKRRIVQLVGSTPAMVDSTGAGDPLHEFLAEELPNVQPYSFQTSSKQNIFERLRASIQQTELHWPEKTQIDRELHAFKSERKRNGTKYFAPDNHHDDCVDALALANQMLKTQKRYSQLMGGSGGEATTGSNLNNPFE